MTEEKATVTRIILKPFVFSVPPKKGSRIATELRFTPSKDPQTGKFIPTEIELPKEVADHEWIREQHADGHLERPEVTKQRIDELAKRVKRQEAEDKRILQQAEAALARTQANAGTGAQNTEALEKELNTPVNELQAKQGADADKTVDELQEQNTSGS